MGQEFKSEIFSRKSKNFYDTSLIEKYHYHLILTLKKILQNVSMTKMLMLL